MFKQAKKIFGMMEPGAKRWIPFFIVLMFIGAFLDSISVSLMLPLLTTIEYEEGWNTSWYAKAICNAFQIQDRSDYLIAILLMIALIFIVKNIYMVLEYHLQNLFIHRQLYYCKRKLFGAYLDKPYTYFLNANTMECIRIISSDTSQTFAALQNFLTFCTEGIVCLVLAITVFIISPEIALFMSIVLLCEVLFLALKVKALMIKSGETMRMEHSACDKWVSQGIEGIKIVKVSSSKEYVLNEFSKHLIKHCKADAMYKLLDTLPRRILEAITIASVMLFLIGHIMMGGMLETMLPQLAALVVAAVRLLPSANSLSQRINFVPFAEGAVNNLLGVLGNEKNEDSKKVEIDRHLNQKIQFKKEICGKDICYSYPNSSVNVLEHANIAIHKGQAVGIVGLSGAGKTTLMDILLGLLTPEKGQITVDGIDIHNNLPQWFSLLAYIPQQIFLTDDTIRNNIAFGEPSDTIKDEKIWTVLAEAQLDTFVQSLPDGLETEVGERGIRLSGGQRQRMGIARALYRDPELLLFDEATSALDNETEKAVMEAIDKLKGKRTIVIIAHRLTSLDNCDIIYRVENHSVVKER